MADPPGRRCRTLAAASAVLVLAGALTMAVAVVAGPGIGAAGYVSEAGTTAYPLAGTYRAGALLLAGGVALLGGALSRAGHLAAALLGVAALGAALSGAVPCSGGCPLPPFETATGADLVHTAASIMGMAAAVFAMVALAVSSGAAPPLRRLARVGAAAALPLSAAVALAMLFLGRGTLTGLLERALLLTAAGWLVATATLRARGGAPDAEPTMIEPDSTHADVEEHQMTTRTSREIHLAARPRGWPTADTFRLVETAVPEPGPGQLLVRNLFMSVDPYMRGRMNDVRSYVPPFQVGQVLDGAALGEVVSSGDEAFKPGDVVLHGLGWREYALLEAGSARAVDPALAPTPSAYLGALGMTGLTAYVGLLDIAAMKPGDVVFVSGAAGAVGSIAGQIAKVRGASRVIGSAGSAAKVSHLTENLGFDAAFDYHDAPVREQLRAAAPKGIDVYFDNVGSDHLEAAIFALRDFGRAALCGAISQYNDATPPETGPRNLALAVTRRLSLRGFIVTDHGNRMRDFVGEMAGWLRDGSVRHDETVLDGIENAPEAFLGMLRGVNLGKMIVRL